MSYECDFKIDQINLRIAKIQIEIGEIHKALREASEFDISGLPEHKIYAARNSAATIRCLADELENCIEKFPNEIYSVEE